MPDHRRVIEMIRKLMAKTPERGATEAEAASAIDAVRRLMEQHNLSILDVKAEPGSREWADGAAWETSGLGDVETPYLGAVIQQYFNVVGYVVTERHRDGEIRTTVSYFGEPVNVEIAAWAYRFLHGTFQDLWTAYRVRTGCRKSKQRSFYHGLAVGILSRLPSPEAEGPEGPGGRNELAVAYRANLDRAFEDAHGEMKTRRSRGPSDVAVAVAGRAADREVNIARPVGGRPEKALPQPRAAKPKQGSFFGGDEHA